MKLLAALMLAGSAVTLAPTATADPSTPCDWVSAREATDILGQPVAATPRRAGCWYAISGEQPGLGISSEVLAPGAMPATAEPVCITEPMTTPPSTTVIARLTDNRIYRATATYQPCDTVTRFARIAIGRFS